ncbi:Hydrogenase expression/formation protein HypE [Fervidicola ferrireducens]|uniref:Hydrogenase expression/formation protein HypE n=1 Tax=Fervidicola ferrireducens TaxID=520764 RepID=A0A140L6C0_9FIRM|nr:AIR synthase family protein [Fervidicola ferrireducens]KXG76095.1 Hydrogenase expression/formation protein HypE [Fervidicola ferrireducens]
MKTGKIPPEILKKTVYPFLGEKRSEVLVHSGFGEDCCVIDFGDYVAVASSDPITGADTEGGYFSVFVACNDVAACGAKPVGILITLLLPEGSSESMLLKIMESIDRACREIGIEVLGGHTEVTPAVTKPVISATAIGMARKDGFVTSAGAKPGDDIIVTKYIGLEGTAILALDFEKFLREKLPEETVKKAQSLVKNISVIEDGLTASAIGVSAMHDITEGGLLGAIWEITEASGVGAEIYADRIPILPETQAICQVFEIDPLALISSGSMLICTSKGQEVVKALKEKSIPATIIGSVTSNGRYILKSGQKFPITPPERDELYRAIEKIKTSMQKK